MNWASWSTAEGHFCFRAITKGLFSQLANFHLFPSRCTDRKITFNQICFYRVFELFKLKSTTDQIWIDIMPIIFCSSFHAFLFLHVICHSLHFHVCLVIYFSVLFCQFLSFELLHNLCLSFVFSWFYWWIWPIPTLPCQWETIPSPPKAHVPVSMSVLSFHRAWQCPCVFKM